MLCEDNNLLHGPKGDVLCRNTYCLKGGRARILTRAIVTKEVRSVYFISFNDQPLLSAHRPSASSPVQHDII